MRSHLTNCGISGIAEVPYGFHMCHFYKSPEALLHGLTGYFLGGLRNNERCFWLASRPLPADEVRNEIGRFPELESAVKSGQLRILDAQDWYGTPTGLDAQEIVERWLAEEARAIADGFEGLRITDNTSFVPRDQWDRLMHYEGVLHDSLSEHRILTWCCYCRDECEPVDILEVAQRHHGVLDKAGDHWQVFIREPIR